MALGDNRPLAGIGDFLQSVPRRAGLSTAIKIIGRSLVVIGLGFAASIVIFNVQSAVALNRAGHGITWANFVLGCSAGLCLAAGWIAIRWARAADFSGDGIPFSTGSMPPFTVEHLAASYTAVNHRLEDARTRSALIRVTVGSWEYNERVSEQVELRDSTYLRTVTRALRCPKVLADQSGGRLYIPLLRHRKGRLIDTLTSTIDGQPAETIPYAENTCMSMVLLSELFMDSFDDRAAAEKNQPTFAMLASEVANPNPRARSRELDGAFTQLIDAWSDGRSGGGEQVQLTERQKRFLRVCYYLADYYVIFGYVDMKDRTTASVTISYSEPRSEMRRGLSNTTRRWMGLPTYRFRVPIPGALDALSYHFRAEAPEGTYLYRATARHRSVREERAEGALSGEDMRQLAAASTADSPDKRLRSPREVGTDIKLSPTFGTPLVHFYARGLGLVTDVVDDGPSVGSDRLRGLWLDLDFRPIPPGPSAAITLLSVYLAIITTSLAFGHDRAFVPDGSHTVLAIVLGLPAFMSAWVASRFDAKGLRQASPVMVLELLALMTISLLSVGVAAFKSTAGKDEKDAFPVYTFVYGHVWWATVWLLSITLALVTMTTLVTRLSRYGNALRRSTVLRHHMDNPS